jgi:hypothetical protein
MRVMILSLNIISPPLRSTLPFLTYERLCFRDLHRSSQEKDIENESRGGREERVEETHILQVDAPMSANYHSVPDLGHERQITPSTSIERPHWDAERGEFVTGGC